ncbi:MAG: NAD-dependent epimerase/dehydratase family protein [Polyangiales bacterium]
MRVLVVAGTGFLGGHAARAFVAEGHEVTVLVRSAERAARDARLRGARIVVGSVSALPALERQDAVVYAAGAWLRDDPASAAEVLARCREVYVEGPTALAERARAWGAHFVFLSGTSRFGDREGPLREDSTPGPMTTFGEHKRKSEAILAGVEGLRWTAIVPPEVYGAHDVGGYARFVFQRVRDRRFVILGDGTNRWSLCNVRNVADAMVKVAGGDGVGPLLVADAEPTSQRELAATIARAMGRTPSFPTIPRVIATTFARLNALRPGPRFSPTHVRVRTRDAILDTTKATTLGIVPRHGLREGIEEAVAWWQGAGRATV